MKHVCVRVFFLAERAQRWRKISRPKKNLDSKTKRPWLFRLQCRILKHISLINLLKKSASLEKTGCSCVCVGGACVFTRHACIFENAAIFSDDLLLARGLGHSFYWPLTLQQCQYLLCFTALVAIVSLFLYFQIPGMSSMQLNPKNRSKCKIGSE